MKKLKSLIFISLLTISNSLKAQNWVDVGGGLTGGAVGEARCFYNDSDRILYAGGTFIQAGGITAKGIASWNGMSWDSLGGGWPGGFIQSMTKYHNQIIASGDRLYPIFISKWNGTSWDSLGAGTNDIAGAFLTLNDTLLVGGRFTQAGSSTCNLLAKWDGQQWYGCSLPFPGGGSGIWTMDTFQNQVYLGGSFYDSTGMSTINGIARWDGNQVYTVGVPISISYISKIMRYKGELYIGGSFQTTCCGNYLIKWNGTSYSSVGGGMDNEVYDMVVFNGDLIVVGAFRMAGIISVQNIAKWDGQQWYKVGNDTFDNNINSAVVFRNELYISGGFYHINSQPINHIAKYIGPLSVPENSTSFSLDLFPQPANEILNIRCREKIKRIIIRNTLGQEIISENNRSIECVDISMLPGGIYFLEAEIEHGRIVKKFVKE